MTPHIFRMPLDKKHCRAHTHVAGNEKRKSLAPVNRSGYLLLVFFTHIFVCLYFSYWVKQVGLHDSEWGGDDERGGKKSARCRTGSSHSVDTPCSIPGEGGRGGGGLGSLYHARGLSHAYTSPHACTQYTQEKKGKDASQPPRALNSSRESALRRPRQRGGSTVLFTHARCCIFSMTLSSRK